MNVLETLHPCFRQMHIHKHKCFLSFYQYDQRWSIVFLKRGRILLKYCRILLKACMQIPVKVCLCLNKNKLRPTNLRNYTATILNIENNCFVIVSPLRPLESFLNLGMDEYLNVYLYQNEVSFDPSTIMAVSSNIFLSS